MTESISASILIIGTDLHFCYLMRRYVRESEHPLLFSGPDEKALDLAERERPGLIVVEDGLPENKGRQMIQVLKSNENTCGIPVMLCSWHDEAAHDLRDGADVYLRMPILYGDFLSVLQNLGI